MCFSVSLITSQFEIIQIAETEIMTTLGYSGIRWLTLTDSSSFSYILYEDLCVCVQIQHLGLLILAAKDALDCFKTIPDICCSSVLTNLQGETMNNWNYFGHEFKTVCAFDYFSLKLF